MDASLKQIEAQLAAMGLSQDPDIALEQLDAFGVAALPLKTSILKYQEGVDKLREAEAELEDSQKELDDAKAKLADAVNMVIMICLVCVDCKLDCFAENKASEFDQC